MFDPNSNSISLSNGDDGLEQLQRGSAGWWLTMNCKLAAEGKHEWATKNLETVRRWYGLDRSITLFDADGKATKSYADLQQAFSATYIAWLVEGWNLPQAAEAVAKPLRQKYSSAGEVRGSRLTDEIGRVFRSMLEIDREHPSSSTAKSKPQGKALKPARDPKAKAKASALRNFVSALFWYRTDLLGRLRVVLSPSLLPSIAGLLFGYNVYGYFDWDGLLSELRYMFFESYSVSIAATGYVHLAIFIIAAWLISGAVEGSLKWLLFGNQKAD